MGSGPNGLAGAIALARAGRAVTVFEGNDTLGGGCRSEELTLPGFVHDTCSTVHALALASPFLSSLPLSAHGLELVHPDAPLAHPLDVPGGSSRDMTSAIEAQVERFAPGFSDLILARSAMGPAEVEAHNPNYVGGDINGGVQDLRQLFTRPVARPVPYSTPLPGVFICSSSTPPGGGVHGMSGYWARRRPFGPSRLMRHSRRGRVPVTAGTPGSGGASGSCITASSARADDDAPREVAQRL